MQHQWPAMLRIAGPSSIEELWSPLWGSHNPTARLAQTDVLIYVVCTNTRAFLDHLGVADDTLLLDEVASPQLQRVLVATYSDASQDSWAVKEENLNGLASHLRCELVIMFEEDVEGAIRVLNETAGKVILWRPRQDKLREEDNKQGEDGQKKIGKRLALWSLRDKLFKRSQPR